MSALSHSEEVNINLLTIKSEKRILESNYQINNYLFGSIKIPKQHYVLRIYVHYVDNYNEIKIRVWTVDRDGHTKERSMRQRNGRISF